MRQGRAHANLVEFGTVARSRPAVHDTSGRAVPYRLALKPEISGS